MESIFKLGILLKMTDMVSGPAASIGRKLDTLKSKASSMALQFEGFKSVGTHLAVAGTVMIAILTGTVMATAGTQKALGELASVGVKDMQALERAGQDFSNQWSGTTKAQFIAAAYDIKGGIASLSDVGVAEFAKLAALTGKATKSTTQEMTSLFATAYGIYKDQYARLTDIQFGQMFSGGIAAAVNIFKSTGSGMAGAIENLGAAATVAKRPLEEQLTVLGMLQATMSGREAGTAYKAFIRDVDAAGKKLGMNFYDSADNLKSIDQIMGMLRGKFGDLTGKESAVLQHAFTDESYRLVAQMYTKVNDLTGNIKQLSEAMNQGTIYTEQMATAMNKDIGAGMGIFGQRMHNLVEILGRQLIPILAPIFTGLGNGIMALQRFAEKHGTLTRIIMVSLAIIAGLVFVLGGVALAIGVIGLGIPAVVTGLGLMASGMGLISGAISTATIAAWRFTAALLANPMTWIVVGIVAAVVALGAIFVWMYRRVEWFRNLMDAFLFFIGFSLGTIVGGWKNLAQWIFYPFQLIWSIIQSVINILPTISRGISDAMAGMLNAFPAIFSGLFGAFPAIFSGLYQSGQKIVSTLVNGIMSVASGPVDAVKSIFQRVRKLLPFSDAQEGPFSQLTLSGQRIMQTLGTGILMAAPGLHKAMTAGLAGAALTTSLAINPPPAVSAVEVPNFSISSQSGAQSGNGGGRKIVVQIGKIELSGVKNAGDFINQLQAFVEGYDAE